MLTKALRHDPIIGIELYFQEKSYPAKKILRTDTPRWIENVFTEELVFMLEMYDCSFTDTIERHIGGNRSPSINATITSQSGKKAAIVDAFLAEYFRTKVTLMGGIYSIISATVISIPGDKAATRKRLELAEKKRPSLKRFRNIVDPED